jgi:hypothetical protein
MTKLNKSIALAAAMASLLGAVEAKAQFTYLDNDLLLNFRQTDGGASDLNLTVNLGSVLTFRNLTGTTPITQFTASQLTTPFTDFNNLAFSVVATEKGGAPVTNPYVNNTYWATVGRSVNGVQNTAPTRGSSLSQGNESALIASIGSGAQDGGADLSNTAATTVDGSAFSYHAFAGSGTFGGNISYNIEKSTGSGFTGFVQADFFEVIPGSGDSTYLGYFEFNDTGAMSFVSVTPVPEPTTAGLVSASAVFLFALRRKFGTGKS